MGLFALSQPAAMERIDAAEALQPTLSRLFDNVIEAALSTRSFKPVCVLQRAVGTPGRRAAYAPAPPPRAGRQGPPTRPRPAARRPPRAAAEEADSRRR